MKPKRQPVCNVKLAKPYRVQPSFKHEVALVVFSRLPAYPLTCYTKGWLTPNEQKALKAPPLKSQILPSIKRTSAHAWATSRTDSM